MDSQWLVTKKILADLIWPVRMSQQFASSVCPLVGSQFPGFLTFPSACNGSSRRCPDQATGWFFVVEGLEEGGYFWICLSIASVSSPSMASSIWPVKETRISTGMATNEERIQSSQGGFDALLVLAPNWALHHRITLKHQRLRNRQNSGLWF